MIVAIDGPAASGKSTTARAVAARLGYIYLDTGAMYRAVGLAFEAAGAAFDERSAERLMPSIHLDVTYRDGAMAIWLDGRDVTDAIRTPEAGRLASRVATLGPVRRKLVDEQRRIARARVAEGGGVVLDGRDIGTVVFPEADVKIFMLADAEARAQRRHEELRGRGIDTAFAAVLDEIRQRDTQDATRALAPLRPAPDAVHLDTTVRSVEEQVDLVHDLIMERLIKRTV